MGVWQQGKWSQWHLAARRYTALPVRLGSSASVLFYRNNSSSGFPFFILLGCETRLARYVFSASTSDHEIYAVSSDQIFTDPYMILVIVNENGDLVKK